MATSRFSIPEIDENNDLLDGPDDINAALVAIDDSMTGYDSGTSLPSASTAGKLFYRTDTGVLYFDNGSAWSAVAPDANAGAYKTVHEVSVRFDVNNTAGNYTALVTGGAQVVGSNGFTFQICPIVLTDYAVAGLSTKFRLQAATLVNTVAPAVVFTYSLATVATTAGSSGNLSIATIGSLLGSMTVSNPTSNRNDSGTDFTISTSDVYVIVAGISGTPAVGSSMHARVRLQVRNT